MDDIGRGQARAIVKPEVLAQVKQPGIRVLHFPAFDQHPYVFAFIKIISAQASHDLAPNAVEKRDAVAIWVECLHGLRHADGNADFSISQRRGAAQDKPRDKDRENLLRLSPAHRDLLLQKEKTRLGDPVRAMVCEQRCDGIEKPSLSQCRKNRASL